MRTAHELFKHIFVDNKAKKTLILLHGTGGDESDLLFFDDVLYKKYNILSLKGNIDESGMTRFFRRYDTGLFDQENIREETKKLHSFLLIWMRENDALIDDFIFLGYSNGANMILATLFYFPAIIKTALLLHPMIPFMPKGEIDLADTQVLLTYGEHDLMIPQKESKKAIEVLRRFNARLYVKQYPAGHEITPFEIQDIVKFLNDMI